MSARGAIVAGLWRHFRLSLRLNFRSPAAVVYGFAVPLVFLAGFGGVFREGDPPLWRQLGQLLTITILGGACFGLPTALVAERERGVWRRYRLLPVPVGALVTSTLLARVVLVALAALLQLGVARLVWHTPLPLHPWQFAGAFLVVTLAFLGLGLLVASLARDVPAVQALGQCLFLPMILIGGVGVPLATLPEWAQRVAAFMPGRYAVEVLQAAISRPEGLAAAGFSLGALAAIGAAAGVAGVNLLPWDGERRWRGGWRWLALAAGAWLAVGSAANYTGQRSSLGAAVELSYRDISDEALAAIRFDDLPGDDELVTPMALPFGDRPIPPRVVEFRERLAAWPRGRLDDVGQSVRNLVAVAVIADVAQDSLERPIARAVFDELKGRFPRAELERALGWVALRPGDGTVVTTTLELGRGDEARESVVRERSTYFARKCLGKLRGRLPE